MSEISYRLCLLFIIISKINAFSSHWKQVLPKVCSETTSDNRFNALLDCDQLMDREAKNIFDDCVYEVTGSKVNEQKPRICYYYRKSDHLDSCKSSRYKEKSFTVKQIIRKEVKHMWCLMRIARPLGWEQLCTKNLPQIKKQSIRRCDQTFSEITNPISHCYGQVFGRQNDGRPLGCRSIENIIELWQCLQNRSKSITSNRLQELEQMTNRYMECLRNV